MRLFSDRDRPVHLGPFPLERLERARRLPPLDDVPPMAEIPIADPDAPTSIVNATGEYQSMLDAIREGLVARTPSACPEDPLERSEHLKAFGYFNDASMVGAGPLVDGARLAEPRHNAGIATLAQTLRTQQTKTLAAGIDMIMADLKESMEAPPSGIESHTHALVYLYAFPRDPGRDERGTDWLYAGERSAATLQLVRASLRASETASVIANYLRVLGHSARAHSYTSTDVDLNRLTVAAGLATVENGELVNPYLGTDSIAPFFDVENNPDGGGAIMLCRTSNPGGDDFQSLVSDSGSGPKPLYVHVAERAASEWSQLGDCGLVVGATYPTELAEVRSIVGDLPLLVPGVGAQGGDAATVMEHGASATRTGLIVNSSRAILYASDGDDFADAARTEAERTALSLRV